MLANTVGVPPGDSPAATAASSASAFGSGLFAWQAPMTTRKAPTAARLGLTRTFYLVTNPRVRDPRTWRASSGGYASGSTCGDGGLHCQPGAASVLGRHASWRRSACGRLWRTGTSDLEEVLAKMRAMREVDHSLLGRIHAREARVGVVGLGYVGLPLSLAFGEAGFPVLGLDIDARKIEKLKAGESYISSIASAA